MLQMHPLHIAVRDGRKADVERWVTQVDPNIRCRLGRTPLRLAIEDANTELCECLMRAGASLVEGDNQGRFPLSFASPAFRIELARIAATLERERLGGESTEKQHKRQRL